MMITHPDAAGGPDDGHTFVISVRSRGSYKVVGEAHHHDADWMNERPLTLTVRAWSLPAAMRAAALVGLNDWEGWGEPDEVSPPPPPMPNTKEQNIAFRKDWDRRVDEGRRSA
jgi:hypothetical protein